MNMKKRPLCIVVYRMNVHTYKYVYICMCTLVLSGVINQHGMTLTQRLIGHIPLNVDLDVIFKHIHTYTHTYTHMAHLCAIFLILS